MAALLMLATLALCGCRPVIPEGAEDAVIYATVYPLYAMADAVLRDVPGIRLRCLVQPQDGCLRSYALSDWDRALLGTADAVIAGGRGLESFESALFALGEGGPAVSAVLYNLPLYNASTAHGSGESESHLDGPNPHLYMSVDGAKQIVESVAAAMLTLDPDYSESYAQNADDAAAKLDALAGELHAIAGDLDGKPVALMNEALIYTAQDYGLDVAAWIDRESGVALYDDALKACVERLQASGAKVVLTERQAPPGFVRALEDAGFCVARLDILSTRHEEAGFETYLQAQRDNARALRAAFDAAESANEEAAH